MKKFLRIIRNLFLWTLIALTAEFGAFYYINNVFLKQGSQGEITKLDISQNKTLKNLIFDFPSDADLKSVKISDDNLFMAYTQNGDLKVEDLTSGKINTVFSDKSLIGNTIYVNNKKCNRFIYQWVPDRDRLLMTYTTSGSGGNQLKLYSYAAPNNEKREEDKFSKYFSAVSQDRYVTDLKSSGMTGSVYIKVDGGNRYSKIYYYDINSDVYPVDVGSKVVENMAQLQHEDKLFFDNSNHNSISMFHNISVGYGTTTAVDFNQGLKIIGSNIDDNTYAARVDENGEVSKIYYTNPDGYNFYGQDIPSSIGATIYFKDLLVQPHGGVYINDKKMCNVTNASTGKSSNYQGILLQLNDQYAICYDNGKIIFEKLK